MCFLFSDCVCAQLQKPARGNCYTAWFNVLHQTPDYEVLPETRNLAKRYTEIMCCASTGGNAYIRVWLVGLATHATKKLWKYYFVYADTIARAEAAAHSTSR